MSPALMVTLFGVPWLFWRACGLAQWC